MNSKKEIYKMTEMTIEEIKESQKETLLIFRDFCEKNQLKYYLAFGTLLGAVRHKGFIPWDDDIDILMPREDYNFLIGHFNEVTESDRKVISKEICPDFYTNFAKIIDKNTAVTEYRHTLEIGVWIDVFPMDYLIDDIKKYEKVNKTIGFINILLGASSAKLRKSRALYKNIIILLMHIFLPSEKTLLNKKAKYEAEIISSKSSDTYGLLYRNFGKYGVPRFPKNYFEPAVKLEFEGELFDSPKEYDTLLKDFYDDYMTLPPQKKQISHHTYTCHRKES